MVCSCPKYLTTLSNASQNHLLSDMILAPVQLEMEAALIQISRAAAVVFLYARTARCARIQEGATFIQTPSMGHLRAAGGSWWEKMACQYEITRILLPKPLLPM